MEEECTVRVTKVSRKVGFAEKVGEGEDVEVTSVDDPEVDAIDTDETDE
jgi:hypothetical protein